VQVVNAISLTVLIERRGPATGRSASGSLHLFSRETRRATDRAATAAAARAVTRAHSDEALVENRAASIGR